MLLQVVSLTLVGLIMLRPTATSATGVVDGLRAELETVIDCSSTSMSPVVTDMKTNASFAYKVVRLDDLDLLLEDEWNLPEEIVTKFHSIAIASSMQFDKSYQLMKLEDVHLGVLEEFLGAAQLIETNDVDTLNLLEVTYVHIMTNGSLHPMEHCWTDNVCTKKVFGICTCHQTPTYCQEQGFKASEVNDIETTLRVFAFQYLLNTTGHLQYEFNTDEDRSFLTNPINPLLSTGAKMGKSDMSHNSSAILQETGCQCTIVGTIHCR